MHFLRGGLEVVRKQVEDQMLYSFGAQIQPGIWTFLTYPSSKCSFDPGRAFNMYVARVIFTLFARKSVLKLVVCIFLRGGLEVVRKLVVDQMLYSFRAQIQPGIFTFLT